LIKRKCKNNNNETKKLYRGFFERRKALKIWIIMDGMAMDVYGDNEVNDLKELWETDLEVSAN
jgi:hypothetical protein